MSDSQYPAQMDGFRLPAAETVNTPFSMQAAAAVAVEPEPDPETPEQPAVLVAAPAEKEK